MEKEERKIKREEEAIKNLEDFFKKDHKTIEDLNEIHCLIEDSLEKGYNVRKYISIYNESVGEFNNKKE
jgi:hypothetical protein